MSGACLADVGNDVLCLDGSAKIKILEDGGIQSTSRGLLEMVRRNVEAGRLTFTTNVAQAAQYGTIQFIAVGTPPDEDGSADLQYVLAAARNIGKYMDGYRVVVDKSTKAGRHRRQGARAALADELAKRGSTFGFSVVSDPEFLKEVRPSMTSCGRTALWSGPRIRRRSNSCASSTRRSSAITTSWCSWM